MKPALRPGLRHELRFIVTPDKTVPALYPESEDFLAMPAVFATGYLVGLLEWACILAIRPCLEEASQITLGTHVDVSHSAATPPGLEVTVRAELLSIEGHRLRFKVEAHDGHAAISTGWHERALVDRGRFEARVQAKMPAHPKP